MNSARRLNGAILKSRKTAMPENVLLLGPTVLAGAAWLFLQALAALQSGLTLHPEAVRPALKGMEISDRVDARST